MSGKSIISNSYLEDIGDAIRYKKGTDDTYYPSQMGDAIRSIEGIVPTGTMEIDVNGVYNVTEKASVDVDVQPDLRPLSVSENGEYQPDGYDGYDSVIVDVEPALDSLTVTENGLYLPESGVDGYDRVTVNVPQPSGSTTITQNGTYNVADYEEAVVSIPMSDWSAPTLVYEGDFDAVTSAFAVTELPNGDAFFFDRVVVEISNVQQGQNVNKRTYWRSDCPMTGYNEPLIIDSGSNYRYNVRYHAVTTITIEDDTYIGLVAQSYDENSPTTTWSTYQRKEHGGYDKITAYAWWSWNCPAGTHIKITGYNRIQP